MFYTGAETMSKTDGVDGVTAGIGLVRAAEIIAERAGRATAERDRDYEAESVVELLEHIKGWVRGGHIQACLCPIEPIFGHENGCVAKVLRTPLSEAEFMAVQRRAAAAAERLPE